jgi:DNA cross-link repair 1A protein
LPARRRPLQTPPPPRADTSHHTPSQFELSAFALSVDYERIIATVNVGSPQSRAKMAKWFERWKAERKRRAFVPVTPRASTFF